MREVRSGALVVLFFLLPQLTIAQQGTWTATGAASPQAAETDAADPLLKIEDQTVRERVRVSVGGAQIRVRLSNEYGATPLLIGAVTVAVPIGSESVRPSSLHTVTF